MASHLSKETTFIVTFLICKSIYHGQCFVEDGIKDLGDFRSEFYRFFHSIYWRVVEKLDSPEIVSIFQMRVLLFRRRNLFQKATMYEPGGKSEWKAGSLLWKYRLDFLKTTKWCNICTVITVHRIECNYKSLIDFWNILIQRQVEFIVKNNTN